MRCVISSSEDLRIFKDFFFIAVNHGFKKRIPISNFDRVVSLVLTGTCLDIEHPEFNIDHLHLDMAITFLLPVALSEGYTGLWSDFDFTVRLLGDATPSGAFISQSGFRIDPFCNFAGLGGFRFIQLDATICSISAYSLYKHPFFKRNNKSDRQGAEVTAADLYNHARVVDSWKAHMSRGLNALRTRSHGARLELRVEGGHVFEVATSVLRDKLDLLSESVRWYSSAQLFSFVLGRMEALFTLRDRVYDLRQLNQHSLSVYVAVAFLLGSLVHRPDQHKKIDGVRSLLDAHQNQESATLMCSSLLELDGQGTFVLTQLLPWDVLARHFSDQLIRDAKATFAIPRGVPRPRPRSPSPSPSVTPPPLTRRRLFFESPPAEASTSRSASVSSSASSFGIGEPTLQRQPSPSFSASSFDVSSSVSGDQMDLSSAASIVEEVELPFDPSLNLKELAAALEQLEIKVSLVNAPLIRSMEAGMVIDSFGLNWEALKNNHFWIKTKSVFASLPLDHVDFPRLFADLLLSELVSLFGGWDKYLGPDTELHSIGDLGCDLFKSNNLSRSFLPGSYYIDTDNKHKKAVFDRLLPKVSLIQQDFNQSLHLGTSAWKKYASRNFFILFTHFNNSPDHLSLVTRFHQAVITYITGQL